jgi:hypothetical protein
MPCVPKYAAVNPLRYHRLDRVRDLRLGAAVGQTGREPSLQADRPSGRAKQQSTGVRRVVPAVKRGHDLTPSTTS